MLNRFVEYISKYISLSEEEIQAISKTIQIRESKKGTVLLREGQIAREGYFILKGCIRKYTIVRGEEKSTNFFTEEEWVASPQSYSGKVPSDHYLTCVEDCSLIVGNQQTEQEFYSLYQRFPRLEVLTRTVMENEISKYQEMLSTFKSDTPEERYLKLIQTRPELFQRVPLHQLASFIGVKPESLSRIRKRLMNKQ